MYESFYGSFLAPYLELFDDHVYHECVVQLIRCYGVQTDISEKQSVPAWWSSMRLLYFVDKDHSDFSKRR